MVFELQIGLGAWRYPGSPLRTKCRVSRLAVYALQKQFGSNLTVILTPTDTPVSMTRECSLDA
jgi:hypothetical protein